MSKTVQFQTILFSMQYKHKKVLFQAIQFSISTQFSFIWPIGPYQMLPLRARVNLEAKAMEECSTFPKVLASLEPHHLVSYSEHSLGGGRLGKGYFD